MNQFRLHRCWPAVLLACACAAFAADLVDSDGDGIPDPLDNCVLVANVDQADSDNDGFGNVCDGDINNDGVVNALDLSLMRLAFGSNDKAADLNGDGRVNALDLALLRTRFGLRAGPTGLPLDAGLVADPPLADSIEIFEFDKPLADGRNAIVLMDFNGAFEPNAGGGRLKQPDRIVMQTESGLVLLNDFGLFGDEKAGDGVFSGLLRFDRNRAARDVEQFLARARKAQASRVLLFNSREGAATRDFNPDQPFEPAGPERRFVFALPDVGIVAVLAVPFPKLMLFLPPSTNASKTLLMTDLGVVQDLPRTFTPCRPNGVVSPFGNPNGAWSFKTLMTNMANTPVTGITPQVFVNDWLKKWLVADNTVKHSDGIVVPFPIPARPALLGVIQTLQPGWNPNVPATLDMDRLPFRLLAIVNRVDLAQANFYGPGSPGELRFVFGLLERQGNVCIPSQEMTVILEYKVPTSTCLGLKNLANDWIALDALPLGGAAYNAALQALTDQVTLPNAFPGKFNGSAIGQVRSNEVRLGLPWELREFTLQASPIHGKLLHETVKNTPDPSHNRSLLLSQWIAAHSGEPVPRQFGGDDFIATANRYGPAAIPANPPWNGLPVNATTPRFTHSVNTCGGCHRNETGTAFTMVHANGALNAPAGLAGFLTGITVADAEYGAPPAPGANHHFNDLFRRGQMLDQIAAKSCLLLPQLPILQAQQLFPIPLPFPHASMFSPPFVH